ncbi:hypothetical protein [Shouchella lonarensis]|uniref:ComG operon protein 7 n=1 Tax=Shouchella lonarensis TaxID=1464122 RepID=A0A1G6NRL5_9BACI|nr:hypothetical protein [Shouchella lonarensis]SDC70543.1 hypothetical protein SAMN05421737_11349 [Shouchella lonarensis]
MSSKYVIIILSVLLVIVSVIAIMQYYESYRVGDVETREELLTEAMWQISHDPSLDKEKIETIKVLKSYAGVPPFNYSVAVDLKNGERIRYSWGDVQKKRVDKE